MSSHLYFSFKLIAPNSTTEMGSQRLNVMAMTSIFLIFFITSFQPLTAVRQLQGERGWKKGVLMLESLQKGPVPPSGPSGCSYVPRKDVGTCPIIETPPEPAGRLGSSDDTVDNVNKEKRPQYQRS